MDKCSTLRVLSCTNRGNHSSYASTDVLTHNNRDRCAVRNCAGSRKSLQNTNRRRAGLNDRGKNRTCKNTQDRILKHKEQLLESRNVTKTRNSTGHSFHTEHKGCETKKNHTDVFLLIALCKHKEHNTNKCKNRCEGRRLQKLQEHIASRNTAKAQDPSRYRSTDIGTHNYVDRLFQGHQLGVYKAYNHNRCCRRTLNNSSNTKTCKKSRKLASGEFTNHVFKLTTSTSLQSAAHKVHTEKEQTKSTYERKYVKNIH